MQTKNNISYHVYSKNKSEFVHGSALLEPSIKHAQVI
jgi:hypothetical protein